MIKNWKTTLAGIAAIVSVVARVVADPGTLTATDVTALLAALGLLFAKDHNVTGGTKAQ